MRHSRGRSTLAFIALTSSAALLALSTVQAPSVLATEAHPAADAVPAADTAPLNPSPENNATPAANLDEPNPARATSDTDNGETSAVSNAHGTARESDTVHADATDSDTAESDGTTSESTTGEETPQNDGAQSDSGKTLEEPQSEGGSIRFRRATDAPIMFSNPNDSALSPAVRATGGSGQYRDVILWMGWPKGELLRTANDSAAAKRNVPTSRTQHNYVDISPRVRLVTTCTISNLRYAARADVTENPAFSKPVPIISYRPGGWRGDFLDDLYNIGGVHGSNQMNIGITNHGQSAKNANFNFNVACQAQILTRETAGSGNFTESTIFPIDGLVITDAESAGYWKNNREFVQAQTNVPANWYLLDRIVSPACTRNPAELNNLPNPETTQLANATFAELNGDTIRMLPNGRECVTNVGTPGATLFAKGVSSATITVQGHGQQAVALGIIVPRDLGDAPATYGEALALYHPTWTNPLSQGTTNLTRGATPTVMGASRYTLGETENHDVDDVYSSLADLDKNDDALKVGTAPEDKVWEVGPGGVKNLTIRCQAGVIAGWVDWNLNGIFDETEKSREEVTCNENSKTATLSWVIPDDVLRVVGGETDPEDSKSFVPQSQTVMRLRSVAPNESAAQGKPIKPTGVTFSGEVEDHGIQIFAARLQLINKVDSTKPYPQTALAAPNDWRVAALFNAPDDLPDKEFAENGRFVSTVPNGELTLSVNNVLGYTHDGWVCQQTPGSILAPGKVFSSTFKAATNTDSANGKDLVTMSGSDHMTCTITHRPMPGQLTWSKVDHQKNPLKGSEWRLDGPEQIGGGTQITVKDCVQNPCSPDVRDVDPEPGKFRVTDLKWGEYTLTETRPPAGYVLNTATTTGTTEYGQIVNLGEITNQIIDVPSIPLTGGTSSIFYVLAGGGLTVVAIAGAAAIGNRGRSRG